MKLVEVLCAQCGETYKIRGPDRHVGSDYCFAQAVVEGYRARGWGQIERTLVVITLLAELGVPSERAFGGAEDFAVEGEKQPFKGLRKVERLYAPLNFIRAYRETVSMERSNRARVIRMLLDAPEYLEASQAATVLDRDTGPANRDRDRRRRLLGWAHEWENKTP